jgi:gamma-glutamyl hercynylcysteine S-oxide synthase
MEAGGYARDEWWSDAGRSWLADARAAGVSAPKYWFREGGEAGGGEWCTRSMDRRSVVDPTHPVIHVCYYEAEAYTRWAGKRLPTELEWEAAATWDPAGGRARAYPWGDQPPSDSLANIDQLTFGTAPVGAYPRNVSPVGCYGMIGDVWEWTSSDFAPYPGYETFPYKEYSELFFGPPSDYKVLRGGSWATRPLVARTTFRNWDYPIRRQIFSGFRCASGA